MTIGIVAGPYLPIPPVKYGGTERVLYYLIKGLKELGHHVILFAPGDSQIDCELVPIIDKGTGFSKNAEEDKLLKPLREKALQKTIEEVKKNLHRIDILHSHGIDISQFGDVAHLFTLHLEIVLSDIDKTRELKYFKDKQNLFYNTISYNALETSRNLNVVGSIYHGFDPEDIPFNPTPQDYLAYLGRYSYDKNPHLAMQLAIELNKRVKVAARYRYEDDEYFQNYCKLLLGNSLIDDIGEQDDKGKIEMLKNAICNLHPTSFREPFGLTVLEASYCGTPTLAIRRGSMSELIEDGKSGLLVEDYTEGYFRFNEILNIDRNYIRQRAERLFHYKIMAKQYELAYENISRIFKDGINHNPTLLVEFLVKSRQEIKDQYERLTNQNINL